VEIGGFLWQIVYRLFKKKRDKGEGKEKNRMTSFREKKFWVAQGTGVWAPKKMGCQKGVCFKGGGGKKGGHTMQLTTKLRETARGEGSQAWDTSGAKKQKHIGYVGPKKTRGPSLGGPCPDKGLRAMMESC